MATEKTEKSIVPKKAELVTNINSPAEMIRTAMSSGADLTQLEKLLELQERWEANEARKAYHKAMSEFKANPPKIDKDRTVKFNNTKYSHASLYNVVDKISTELSKYGLSASWRTQQNGKVVVTCKITHQLGHFEETTLAADADTSGSKNAIQAIGSTVTYLERYTLLAATGLATYDQDTDSVVEQEKLDENKLKIIQDLIKSTETDESQFLTYMEVANVADILKTDYIKAKTALEAKKKVTKNANS